jgi:glycosyltransferase involved in cell wall biosynthesis
MGAFLEETIRSVLDQDYPRIEYLVMDGGSTDHTLDILERYRHRLRFVSPPDAGQATAINYGFDLTGGEIFAFLNADDTYLQGAVAAAVQGFSRHPQAGVIYGGAWHVAGDGSRLAAYPVEPFDAGRLARRCFVCQPAAFLRREVFATAGRLDPSLRFALDYDLWIRIARRCPMRKIDASSLHRDARPSTSRFGAGANVAMAACTRRALEC